MKLSRLLLISAGAALCSTAYAQEEPFKASIAFGYVGTTGNTETTTLNTEVLATWRTERWTHNAKFQGLGAQENAATKAERYYLEEKSDYNIDERQYIFGLGTYTDDRFSGFESQATVSAGYGRYLVRRDGLSLQAFGGLGYRESDVVGAGTEGEGIVTFGENLAWALSDNAALTQSFTSDVGEELTVSKFEIGLETNIVGRITTKLAFQARNTSEVPAGTEKTDTMTSVSLVYGF
jgi:putative salt-induced outer membrane protein YdiY